MSAEGTRQRWDIIALRRKPAIEFFVSANPKPKAFVAATKRDGSDISGHAD